MNSLRRDIHSAFEVIAPPVGGMPERVVQTVLADKRRPRKERMTYRLRVSLALVAGVLVAAVAVSAFITWNSLRSNLSPAGVGATTSLAQLEARPLRIQEYQSALQCKSGPFHSAGVYGSGPIYGFVAPFTASNWGMYDHYPVFAETPIAGPILIRAIDVVLTTRVVFIGDHASGSIVGTDTLDGSPVTQRIEAVIDEGHASRVGNQFEWYLLTGFPSGSSGSTGWQIDGADFSEIYYIC